MKASNYLKKSLTDNDLFKCIEFWFGIHCFDGAESAIYDMDNLDDFLIFADNYGFEKAKAYKTINRFWLDGYNHKSPVMVGDLREMIDALYDMEDIMGWIDRGADVWFM